MPNTPKQNELVNSSSSKVAAATIVGIIFIVVLLLLALFIPKPTEFQYEIFRVVLALAAAGFAAILPGAISAKLPWGIGAVGSLAVFSIVYFFSPAQLVADREAVDITANGNELKDFLASLPIEAEVTSKEDLRNKFIKLLNHRKKVELDLTKLRDEIDSLSTLNSKLVKPSEIINYVRSIEPDDPLGDEFRFLSNKRKGPWRPSAKAQLVKISVPGSFKKGKNYSCPEYFGKEVEFRSNLYVLDELMVGEPSVTLMINGTLSSAPNCKEIIHHDFQLSCQDAMNIFSKGVLDCDDNNNPLWKIERKYRIMSAYATKIYKSAASKTNTFLISTKANKNTTH